MECVSFVHTPLSASCFLTVVLRTNLERGASTIFPYPFSIGPRLSDSIRLLCLWALLDLRPRDGRCVPIGNGYRVRQMRKRRTLTCRSSRGKLEAVLGNRIELYHRDPVAKPEPSSNLKDVVPIFNKVLRIIPCSAIFFLMMPVRCTPQVSMDTFQRTDQTSFVTPIDHTQHTYACSSPNQTCPQAYDLK